MYACNFWSHWNFLQYLNYQDTSIYIYLQQADTHVNWTSLQEQTIFSAKSLTTTVFRENMWIYEYEMNAWLHHHRHHRISNISIIFTSAAEDQQTTQCTRTWLFYWNSCAVRYKQRYLCVWLVKFFFSYTKRTMSHKRKKEEHFPFHFNQKKRKSKKWLSKGWRFILPFL